MPDSLLRDEFCAYAATKLQDELRQIEKCLALLTLEQIWSRPNDVSNSIGNLVLHLNGNVRQWIVSSIGGVTFDRDRAAEFSQREPIETSQTLSPLQQSIADACDVIGALTEARLLERVTVQGYDVSILAAVFHVVEHFSLHTGQIVYQTKILTGLDLSLYDEHGQRLNGRTDSVP